MNRINLTRSQEAWLLLQESHEILTEREGQVEEGRSWVMFPEKLAGRKEKSVH